VETRPIEKSACGTTLAVRFPGWIKDEQPITLFTTLVLCPEHFLYPEYSMQRSQAVLPFRDVTHRTVAGSDRPF
jgi:hypothetical protein